MGCGTDGRTDGVKLIYSQQLCCAWGYNDDLVYWYMHVSPSLLSWIMDEIKDKIDRVLEFFPDENTDSNLVTLFSSHPSATYMRQWTGSSLVQVMPCHLLSANPIPKPMLACCQLDSWKQISVKYELEFYQFHSWKCIWKCCLRNGGHFDQRGMKLIQKGLVTPTCICGVGQHGFRNWGLSQYRDVLPV